MEIRFSSVCMAKYSSRDNEFQLIDKLREFLAEFGHLLFPPQDEINVSVANLISSLMDIPPYPYKQSIKTILYDEVNSNPNDFKVEIVFKVFICGDINDHFEVKLTMRIDRECNYYSFVIELLDKAPISAFLDLRRAAKTLGLEFYPEIK